MEFGRASAAAYVLSFVLWFELPRQMTKSSQILAIVGRLTNNQTALFYLKITNLKFNNLTTATSF